MTFRWRRSPSGTVRNVQPVARPYDWVADEMRDLFEDHDQWLQVTWAERGLADLNGDYPCFTFVGLPFRWFPNGEIQFLLDQYTSTINVADVVTFQPVPDPGYLRDDAEEASS